MPVVEPLFLAEHAGQHVHQVQQVGRREGLRNHRHFPRFDVVHVQHIVDHVQQVMGTDIDLLQPLPGLGPQGFILQHEAVQADDRVQRGAHLVAHGSQEIALGAVALLRRQQLGLQVLIFDDALGNAPEQLVHDKDEHAAAEEYAGHDDIRLAEYAHRQIAHQEADKQHDGQVQYSIVGMPGIQLFHIAGKPHKAADIVDHEQAAQIDHGERQPSHHAIHPLLCAFNGPHRTPAAACAGTKIKSARFGLILSQNDRSCNN